MIQKAHRGGRRATGDETNYAVHRTRRDGDGHRGTWGPGQFCMHGAGSACLAHSACRLPSKTHAAARAGQGRSAAQPGQHAPGARAGGWLPAAFPHSRSRVSPCVVWGKSGPAREAAGMSTLPRAG